MAIEGPLEELGIQDVLQLLELARKTGVLTVRSDRLDDEAIVHFEKGTVIFAARRKSTRRLGQLLIRAGKLTEGELQRGLEIQRQTPDRRLAEILLEMGSVSDRDIEHFLRFQMEETIYEVMAWDQGYFRFEERHTGDYRVLARIRVESLLMEGARRVDEWTQLESKVPSADAIPALSSSVGESPLGAPLELRPEEWEVVAEIDGERDVRQISAALGRSTFDVAKMIFGLVGLGVVQIQERRSRMPEREFHAAIREVEQLLGAGEADEAARRAAELESAQPERAELALLSGRALQAQGRMRAAAEAYARAAGLDPQSADAQYRLGFAAVRTGELGRAADAWRKFLRLSDGGPRRKVVAHALAAVDTLDQLLGQEA